MTTAEFLLARKLGKGSSPSIVVEALNVTSNGTYSEEGKAYSPVTVSVQPPANSYQLKSITTPTSLATFEASEMPMPSLKVSVEAQQDLHGYDKPWVGGSGKNKCPINDIEVGANTEEAITDKIPIGSQKTFVISMNIARINGVAITNNALYVTQIITYDSNDVQVDTISPSPITLESGSTTFQTSFTVSDNTSYMIINLRNRNGDGNKNTRKYNVQLESGSQATSYEPYSNICPISGWSEVVVSDVDDVDNPTVTQTTTISLPQTVYGGEVDVVNGGCKDGYVMETFDNTATVTFGRSGQSNWYYTIVGTAVNITELPISNQYEGAQINNDNDNLGIYKLLTGNIRVRVGGEQPADTSAFVAALGTNPLQVLSKIATPTTFTTQPTPIKSLEGTNNLSVDCGEVIEGEYFIELGGN